MWITRDRWETSQHNSQGGYAAICKTKIKTDVFVLCVFFSSFGQKEFTPSGETCWIHVVSASFLFKTLGHFVEFMWFVRGEVFNEQSFQTLIMILLLNIKVVYQINIACSIYDNYQTKIDLVRLYFIKLIPKMLPFMTQILPSWQYATIHICTLKGAISVRQLSKVFHLHYKPWNANKKYLISNLQFCIWVLF